MVRFERRQAIIIAAGYVCGLTAMPWLPGPYLENSPSLAIRLALAFLLPTTAVVIGFATTATFGSEMSGESRAASAAAVRTVVSVTGVVIIGLHLVILTTLTGLPIEGVTAQRAVLVLLGLLLTGIGNVLPRVRPKLAIGIRTMRLLDDPAAWTRVHRVAGYVAVAGGVTTIAVALVVRASQIEALLATTCVAGLAVVVRSYGRESAEEPGGRPSRETYPIGLAADEERDARSPAAGRVARVHGFTRTRLSR